MGKLNELIAKIKEKFNSVKPSKKPKLPKVSPGKKSSSKNLFLTLLDKLKNSSKTNSPKNLLKKKSKSNSSLNLDDIFEKLFSHKSRPTIHNIFVYALAGSTAFSIAKLAAITVRPKPAPLFSSNIDYDFKATSIAGDVSVIKKRNLFNSFDGKKKTKKNQKKDDSLCLESDKKTSVPLTLVNTIVLQNQNKSIAAMKLQGKKNVQSFRRGDQLDRFGRLGTIERLKVIFRNSATGRCEFVTAKKSPRNLKPKFNVLSAKQSKKVLQKSKDEKAIDAEGNKFKIKKSYLNEKLANIGDVLTQAKATPVPNPDGTLRFKITDIRPGGVFSALGIQDQDFITRIDGKPIRSYNEVMSLFNSIKSVKELEITVERNGSEQSLEYSFNE